MRSLRLPGLSRMLGGGGNNVSQPLPYSTILVDDFGASEVWPLVDIAAGTVVPAKVALARNGTQSTLDLQNSAGPVPGTLAPLWDGTQTSDYVNLYTANGTNGLADIFNGAKGSLFILAKVLNAGIWTDGAEHRICRFLADANNYIIVTKATTNNQLIFYYVAGGTSKQVTTTFSGTNWFSVGLSWDKTSGATGELKAFVNGAQVGTTQTSLGTWGGALSAVLGGAILGNNTGGNQWWAGWQAYYGVKFGSVWTPSDFLAMHNAAATAGAENP